MTRESQGPRALRAQDGRQPSKSPQRKLVRFFEQSRDQWKGKCREAKAGLKTLKKKLQRGEGRQQRWQSRVQALERELARLRAKPRALEAAGEAGKKKTG
jgi:predicted nuclease with TOPRIM domain